MSNDVPGWDTVALVYTGWTSQCWKGERLRVWAPCAGPSSKNVSLTNPGSVSDVEPRRDPAGWGLTPD